MRLLRIDSHDERSWRLEDYPDAESRPEYAILSHRWEHNQKDEILFSDLQDVETFGDFPDYKWNQLKGKAGWAKVSGCCKTARELGFSHVWIDGCCVDQKSSAELSESLNSMFAWYRDATLCIAYLRDDRVGDEALFKKSLWFKRGWTLQELIAPKEVWFYDQTWKYRGTRSTLAAMLHEITEIDERILSTQNMEELYRTCAATKLSWAAYRGTLRAEDKAYSLLGLFGINMPILYGEGERNALFRLQTEIFKAYSDHSIFAWEMSISSSNEIASDLFAPSLACFRNARNFFVKKYSTFINAENSGIHWSDTKYSEHAHGLRVQLLMERKEPPMQVQQAYLACQNELDQVSTIEVFERESGRYLRKLPAKVKNQHIDRMNFSNLMITDVFMTTPSLDLAGVKIPDPPSRTASRKNGRSKYELSLHTVVYLSITGPGRINFMYQGIPSRHTLNKPDDYCRWPEAVRPRKKLLRCHHVNQLDGIAVYIKCDANHANIFISSFAQNSTNEQVQAEMENRNSVKVSLSQKVAHTKVNEKDVFMFYSKIRDRDRRATPKEYDLHIRIVIME